MEKIIKAKKVYYDRNTKTVHDRKTPYTTTFDSKAEYECFLMLERLFHPSRYGIKVHHTVVCGDISWKLDFFVSPIKPSLKIYKQFQDIATVVNGCMYSIPPMGLYFEFKGRSDANYLSKMKYVKTLNPTLANSIILISYDDGAFGCYDNSSRRFITHAIVSLKNTHDIVREILCHE